MDKIRTISKFSRNWLHYKLKKARRSIKTYGYLKAIIIFISALLLLWFVMSFFNIASNNLGTCQYADWNLIVMLRNICT